METRERYIKRDKFDFEVGYLVKSPCIDCPEKDSLPKCHKGCQELIRVQEQIACGVSCYNGKS